MPTENKIEKHEHGMPNKNESRYAVELIIDTNLVCGMSSGMQDIRCPACGRLLCQVDTGRMVIRCRRCGAWLYIS